MQIIDIAIYTEKNVLSQREIGRSVGTSHQSVGRCQKRLKNKGIDANSLITLEPEAVKAIYYPNLNTRQHKLIEPNWEAIYKLQQKGQTTMTLYIDYAAQHKTLAMKVSTFFRKYRTFKKEQKLSMKLTHRAGECLQGDFAGSVLKCAFSAKPIQFFVSVHGHSGRFFVLATLNQKTESWIAGFIHSFEQSNGTTEVIVPDNPKALVTQVRPDFVINPRFKAFARHYSVTILPARPRHPQDKALVEGSVKMFKNTILPILRKHVFRTLDDLNAFLIKEVDKYNQQKFQRRDTSRQLLFEEYDKPMLNVLPLEPFSPIEKAYNLIVPANYCIVVDEHAYTVPYRYAHKRVQVHVHNEAIKVWYGHKLIAEHSCSSDKGGHTKVPSHMHPDHLWFEDKPKEYYQAWANKEFGDKAVANIVGDFFDSKYAQSRRGNERARKLQKLVQSYTPEEVVSACRYALSLEQTATVSMLKYILVSSAHIKSDEMPTAMPGALLRGGNYYDQKGIQL